VVRELDQLKEKVVWLPVVLQQNQQRVNPLCVKHVLVQVVLLLHAHRVRHEQRPVKVSKDILSPHARELFIPIWDSL
jgi:hypothetical protein